MYWTLFAQSRIMHQRSGKKEWNNFPNTWGGVNALTKKSCRRLIGNDQPAIF